MDKSKGCDEDGDEEEKEGEVNGGLGVGSAEGFRFHACHFSLLLSHCQHVSSVVDLSYRQSDLTHIN